MRTHIAARLVLTLSLAQTAFAAAPDACTLLAVGDVQAVLGNGFALVPWGAGVAASDYSVCTYQRGAGEVAGVMVLGGTSSAADTLKERARMLGSKATQVTGLGEGAFRVAKGSTVGVWFGRGVWQVNVEVKSSGTPAPDTVQKLAGIVFSRLR